MSIALPGKVGDILVDVRPPREPRPGPAVLLVHGFKGFKDWGMFPPFAERLAQAGFTAVSFNTSGSGVDEAGHFTRLDRFQRNSFSAEISDILTVTSALEAGKLGVAAPSAIGIVGHSRGGGLAILAARQSQRFKALVTWAAISTVQRWTSGELSRWKRDGVLLVLNTRTGDELPMGLNTLHDVEKHAGASLDIQAAAAALTIPWLLIHGSADESVPMGEGEALAALAPRQTSRALFIENAGHTFGAVHPFAGMTRALERVFEESLAWLRDQLA